MKKILKALLLMTAVTTGMTISSCSKDDKLETADALFRPIISEADNIEQGLDENLVPYVVVTWDNYKEANQYTVKMEATDGSDTQEQTTSELTCRFNNLEYDKEYFIYISAANTTTGLSSKPYSLTITTNDYPTKLANVATTDIIDTQVRIKWNGTYSQLKVYKDSNDSLVTDTLLNDEINSANEIILKGLDPRTTYRVMAYDNGAYRGKKRFTTAASENFSGVVFDLRSLPESEGSAYITTEQLAMDAAAHPDDDITYVLQGGLLYKILGGTVLPGTSHKIKFVTGLTLEGNAIFRSGGGIGMTSGQDVAEVVFEKIDFISDKAVEGGANEVTVNTDKGFGGRQVFNINGVKATLGKMTFKSCSVTGYRAMVRAQSDNDNINQIVLEDCQINGVGDQGVFTTTNKNCDWQSISMKNCTVTNIVMLCDLRMTTNTLAFNIENCTFCYAPMETTANANTPLFRLGSGNVNLKVKNTLFGPSMATDGSEGGKLQTYTAGVAGSILLNGTPDGVDVENSYKTNFSWTDLNTTGEGDPKIYPLEGLAEAGLSETELWSNPGTGIFTIVGKLPDSGIGDQRWQ